MAAAPPLPGGLPTIARVRSPTQRFCPKTVMQTAILSTLLAGAAAQESQCLGSAGSYGNDKTCLPSWKPSPSLSHRLLRSATPPVPSAPSPPLPPLTPSLCRRSVGHEALHRPVHVQQHRHARRLPRDQVRHGRLRLEQRQAAVGQRPPDELAGADRQAGRDGARRRPGRRGLQPARLGVPQHDQGAQLVRLCAREAVRPVNVALPTLSCPRV